MYDDLEGRPFLGVEGTVYINDRIYLKSPEVEPALIAKMTEVGYTVDAEGTGRLNITHASQCGHCDSIISNEGVSSHGHLCEVCTKPTHIEWRRGGIIEFNFKRDGMDVEPSIAFFIRDYDPKAKELILYAKPITESIPGIFRLSSFSARTEADAKKLLGNEASLYRRFEIETKNGDVELIAIPNVDGNSIGRQTSIDTNNIVGRKQNWKSVMLFDGKVYEFFINDLPVPQTVWLDREYMNGKKLSLANPDAHNIILSIAGATGSVDTYHQDGRPGLMSSHYPRMCGFVKNFVDVEFRDWVAFLMDAPTDGPGFVRRLAGFCAEMSDGQKRHVKDRPNHGLGIAIAGKLLSGPGSSSSWHEPMSVVLLAIPDVAEAVKADESLLKLLMLGKDPFEATAERFSGLRTANGLTDDEIVQLTEGAERFIQLRPVAREIFASYPQLAHLADLSVPAVPGELPESGRSGKRGGPKGPKGSDDFGP